jgi:hypothetical protein
MNRISIAAALLAACGLSPHTVPHDIQLTGAGPRVLSLSHLDTGAPLGVDSDVELRAEVEEAPGLEFFWSAQAGRISGDGARARWRTPRAPGVYAVTVEVRDAKGTARAEAQFGISTAVFGAVTSGLQAGPDTDVDDGGADQVGYYCSIAVDGSNRPHITYFNTTHRQIRYPRWDGSAWQISIVDGPGFNTGRAVNGESVLKLDPAGKARVVYDAAVTSEVRYAEFDGSNWQYSAAAAKGTSPQLALNPAQGSRPAVLYEFRDTASPYTQAIRFAQQAANGTWGAAETVVSQIPYPTTTDCYYNAGLASGTLHIASDGVARTAYYQNCSKSSTQWNPSGRAACSSPSARPTARGPPARCAGARPSSPRAAPRARGAASALPAPPRGTSCWGPAISGTHRRGTGRDSPASTSAPRGRARGNGPTWTRRW